MGQGGGELGWEGGEGGEVGRKVRWGVKGRWGGEKVRRWGGEGNWEMSCKRGLLHFWVFIFLIFTLFFVTKFGTIKA